MQPAASTSLPIEVEKFRAHQKGALRGFFNIRLLGFNNMTIYGLQYFVKGDQRWVSYPSRAVGERGSEKYYSYFSFPNKEDDTAFKNLILKALDKAKVATQVQEQALQKNHDGYYKEEDPFF